MENNKIEDSRDDLPSIMKKRRNKYLAYTKSRLFMKDFSSLGEHL